MTVTAGQLLRWPLRRWLVATLAAAAAALAIGIPTGVVATPFYTRMTPVTWWDYPLWAISAIGLGLIAATYVRGEPFAARAGGGRAVSGGVLSTFAVGCPICNKIVVALLGVGGALDYWAPLQPFLGLLSVALLLTTLILRLRVELSCPSPVARSGRRGRAVQ